MLLLQIFFVKCSYLCLIDYQIVYILSVIHFRFVWFHILRSLFCLHKGFGILIIREQPFWYVQFCFHHLRKWIHLHLSHLLSRHLYLCNVSSVLSIILIKWSSSGSSIALLCRMLWTYQAWGGVLYNIMKLFLFMLISLYWKHVRWYFSPA